MENGRFVTLAMPVPQWMRGSWDRSRDLVAEAEACDDPWKKAVTFDYARRMNDLDLARLSYESIGRDHEEMLRYSHQLESDGQEIRVVRLGSERPSVLERMSLNKFININ